MIDQDEARRLAAAALERWGQRAPVAIRAIRGGWRAHAERRTDEDVTGSSHVLVRAGDGAVLRCPAGASDARASDLLDHAPGKADS